MTIRFTETGKWRDKWFRKLSPTEKLLFLWMIDNCDSAGFWEVDLELAAQETGATKPRTQGACKGLARAYIACGDYIWIRRFITVQRNWPLNPENKAHKSILGKLDNHSEFDIDFLREIENLKNSRTKQGATKPPCISIGKSKGKSNSISSGLFEKFWEIYPKKVNRSACLDTWNNPNSKFRTKTKGMTDDEIIALIVVALNWQANSNDWKEKGGKYIPYPATYLNNKRWEDKPVKTGMSRAEWEKYAAERDERIANAKK